MSTNRPTRPSFTGTIRWLAPALVLLAFAAGAAHAEDAAPARDVVRVVTDASGSRLQVNGRDFLVKGMNWDYIPIGQNYAFDLFRQPEDVITTALDREMSLLAGMGVNAIRVANGIPPRWVKYIHDRYGIWCIVNHTVGRYGLTIDGVWTPAIDYSDPRVRTMLATDVAAMVKTYQGTPGVLMYLLGNENNYGLSWSSFEIEALPKGERDKARAKFLYSLFGEIARATKAQDPSVPVAIANGDLQYLDLVASECKGLDVFGTNVYRGISAGDLYRRVHDTLGIPIMYTEFGCDAFNSKEQREDQAMQAKFLVGQWREIYEKTAGHGQEGNAIGGCIFQWSDGWWKFKQEERLDVHDANASWPDGGYTDDFVQGENNMNEEWWGICAKGFPDGRGLYELYPRAAYYAMRTVFAMDPYAPGSTTDAIRTTFATITPGMAALQARGDQAASAVGVLERARVSGVRMDFETISTGSNLTETPVYGDPPFHGYDKFQSFYTDFQVNPDPTVTAKLSLNIRGNVPQNPIDHIFYENRSTDRVKVYQGSMSWDDRWYTADAFYRTGHYHWGYEGDFFGLYREANYGPNIDLYDADAPVGVELAGKRRLNGLKLAVGPQLWWGANPAVMAKYRHGLGRFDASVVYEHDLALQGEATTAASIPVKPTTKTTFQVKTTRGKLTIEAGGIWAGANKVDQDFQVVGSDGRILRDVVHRADTYGGKIKLSGSVKRLMWYAQAAAMGLVADAGPTAVTTYTGWNLKDSGSGNQRNVIGGFVYGFGKLQVGPNFLWQRPIVGPMPPDARSPGVLRNIFDDPFAVRANRDMHGMEMLLTWDPTPATWAYAWDNEQREDATLAANLGFTYRHFRTGMDGAVGFLSDGVTYFSTTTTTPPRDLWELNSRVIANLPKRIHLVAHAWYGTAEPSIAPDPRIVTRKGVDLHVAGANTSVEAYAKFDDFGPYDYYRDYNLTYPVQLMGDVSHSLGTPQWFATNPQTRIGVRAIWRSLDPYSPRYAGLDGDPNGNEWEFRTYLKLGM